MGIFRSLLDEMRRDFTTTEQRGTFPAMSWEAYQTLFTFNGSQYRTDPFRSQQTRQLLAACGPAYTVLDRRASIIGEARPMFQRLVMGKPIDLFSTRDLAILQRPWQGGTWRLLTMQMEADVAAAGNSYWVRVGDELVRLEPDHVTIVAESVGPNEGERPSELGARLVGYAVQQPGRDPILLDPGEVAHYRPGASVESPWRGESWLAAVASDASSDVEMTQYKGNYLRNGAMPSLAVMYEPTIDSAQLEDFVGKFSSKFSGALNAGKVMHFLGGRDVKTVGATLEQLAFKAVQGAGETRIASAAGVPATVAGFSEALAGSSLNQGNYTATRRLFADAKIRPLLGHVVESLASLVTWQGGTVAQSNGVRLWYDDSQVSFFQEDVRDEADIRQAHAQTIRTLIDAGYEPDAVVAAVTTGNFAALVGAHSGLYSVQLQPAGTELEPSPGESEDTPDDQAEDDAEAGRARHVLANVREVTSPQPLMVVPNVTVHMPEQRQEPPVVHVAPADVRVEPAVVNVTNEPAVVNVTVPDTVVHVATPEVRVEPAVVNVTTPAPVVHVEVPEQRQEAPVVNVTVPEQRQEVPVVNVTTPAPVVNVTNDVQVPSVTVNNEVGVPDVTVNNDVSVPEAQVTVLMPEDEPSRFVVRRDPQGRITEVVEG